MRRVLVTGNAGSGKTTLAAALGARLGVEVIGLDRVVWRPGWRKAPPEERRTAEAEIAARPAWVVDGVSRTILAAADLVVFLDLPRPVCLWRGVRRSFRSLFRSRPELPERCPEILILPHLVGLIWRFPVQTRPGLLAGAQGRRFVHLHSAAEVRALLAAVEAEGLVALDRASRDAANR